MTERPPTDSTPITAPEVPHPEHLFSSVVAAIGDGIVVIDAAGRIVAFNPGAERLFGYTADELLGEPLERLVPAEHSEAHNAAMAGFLLAGPNTRSMAERELIEGVRQDGSRFPAAITIASIYQEGQWYGVALVRDISDYVERNNDLLARLEQQQRLAQTDALTGLWNRRALHAAIERELARVERGHDPFTLVYMDLDHFKPVNDTWGHAFGDEILIRTAQRFGAFFRAMDFVARVGGDEFAVLAPASAATYIARRVETLRHQLRTEFHRWGVAGVTLSAGVLTCRMACTDAERCVRAADALMYRAKHGGRDSITSGVLDTGGLVTPCGRPLPEFATAVYCG